MKKYIVINRKFLISKLLNIKNPFRISNEYSKNDTNFNIKFISKNNSLNIYKQLKNNRSYQRLRRKHKHIGTSQKNSIKLHKHTIKANSIGNNSVRSKFTKRILLCLSIFLLCCINLYLQQGLTRYQAINRTFSKLIFNVEEFRDMDVSDKVISKLMKKSENNKEKFLSLLTLNMIYHNYHIEDTKNLIFNIKPFKKFTKNKEYNKIYNEYLCIFSDINYFPVPKNISNNVYVNFDDSWKNSRTYGGSRLHEGTDIMSQNNIRGYFPVISISSGVVEKKGWLEQGGYRIGVRAANGAYFYYAHLYSYAPELLVGDKVIAGQLLGFMGDTGYSKIEGTVGNFDVHLHVGIYFDNNGEEVSVNPYWILKYLENNKLTYSY